MEMVICDRRRVICPYVLSMPIFVISIRAYLIQKGTVVELNRSYLHFGHIRFAFEICVRHLWQRGHCYFPDFG